MATAAENQLLYITYFGRPADPAGLRYWTVDKASLTPLEAANDFAADVEFKRTVAGKSNQDVINQFYINLFGRDADPAGLAHYTAKVDSGEVSLQQVGLWIAQGAVGQDKVVLAKKLEAADLWTAQVAASTTAATSYTLQNALSFTYGVDYLVPVKGANPVVPSLAATQAAIAALPPAGTQGLIKNNASISGVTEGQSVTFTVTTVDPLLIGKTLPYVLTGLQASDLAPGQSTSGQLLIGANGIGVLSVEIGRDAEIETGETITINFPTSAVFPKPPGSNVVPIIDTSVPPVPSLSAIAAPGGVNEGGIATFNITSANIAPGTQLQWSLPGVNPNDVIGATSGTVIVGAGGVVPSVVIQIANDFLTEGTEVFNFSVTGGGATADTTVTVFDTSVPLVPVLSAIAAPGGVNEGGIATFNITSVNIAPGTQLQWSLPGVNPADVIGATSGTVIVGAGGVVPSVQIQIANDFLTEGTEVFNFQVTGGGATANTTVTVFDTSVAPTAAVLTTSQDISGLNIAAPPATGTFTYFANEETLGQNDQLSRGVGSNAQVTLDVGTQGGFNLRNFSLNGIQTLKLAPSGESIAQRGDVDLSTSTGLLNIDVSNSRLGDIRFNDIQSVAGLRARLADSFSTFTFNFDVNALTGAADRFEVILSEAPIDATTGAALGLVINQGPAPFETNAALETLSLVSTGPTINVIDELKVGPGLNTLEISGNRSLQILPDLGFGGEGNTRIRTINAAALDGDLTGGPGPFDFLTYTSLVSGNTELGTDVTVAGAIGVNRLRLLSAAVPPTDFFVLTQAASDFVITGDGNDQVLVGEGDNTVDAGEGNNTVVAGTGNDSILSGAGADLIAAGAGDNTVNAGDGNNTVSALEGDDFIVTGIGNDSIDAGAGNNIVFAGDGNDTVSALGGDDFILTGAGNDSVNAGGGNDTVDLGAGNDFADTGEGNDSIASGTGSNTILAGGGNDTVDLGIAVEADGLGYFNFTVFADGADSVNLGEGNDLLRIGKDNLTDFDSINGGEGIDTIQLWGSGTLGQSETDLVSRIEQFTIGGTSIIDPITLDDELVRTSDDLTTLNGVNVRRFTVENFTRPNEFGKGASAITLDITPLSANDGAGNRTNIRYLGQSDGDSERVIVDDVILNRFTQLSFGEAFFGDFNNEDTLQIVDGVDAPADDFANITGVDRIELTATADFQVFNIKFTQAMFDAFIGLDSFGNRTPLLITATPSLSGAVLNLDISDLTVQQAAQITVAGSSQLALNITGVNAASVNTTTALFYTPSTDFINTGAGSQTVTAFKITDVQTADQVNLGADNDVIEFRFGLGNAGASLQSQLAFTSIANVETFNFAPVLFNQPVRFTFINTPFFPLFATGLQTINTANGDDALLGIERAIVVNTFGGNDTVSSNAFFNNNLTVFTSEGNDSVTTFGGADFIDVGEGDNTVDAGAGNDSILAGDGNNIVAAGNGDNFVFTGSGNDSITAGSGNDSISAGAGNNTVAAGNGNNTVSTLDGNDSIVTGTGADSINAGDGTNTVESGGGADFVITGTGNDSIFTASAAGQVDNDTVDSGAGNDSILVGLGDDSVKAGLGNDLIVLGSASGGNFPAGTQYAQENAGYSAGDRIDGGGGVDSVSLASDTDFTLSGVQLQSIESVIILANAADVDVTVSSDLFPGNGTSVDGQSVLDVLFSQNLFTEKNSSVDASALVQGEAVNLTLVNADLFTFLGGAGNDGFGFVSNATFPPGAITVQGNGGSDSVDLTNRQAGTAVTVTYATGNDGGNGGTGTGGDIITGYSLANDSIRITGGLLTNIGGIINGPGFGLLEVTNAQLTLGGLADTNVPLTGTTTGRNILNLTGPARSLIDDQLNDAGAIAANINNVGVVGNGLNLGDVFGALRFVTNVTNQALIFQQGQTKTALYLYTESSFDFTNAQAYTVEANELRQLGVFDTNLLTGSELVV